MTMTKLDAPRAPAAAPPRRRRSSLRRHQAIAAWSLALPFVALFVVFTIWPVISSMLMSFTDLRSADLQTPFAVNLVGFDNYIQLFSDPLFYTVALNTAAYVIFGVPLTVVLALVVALGLNNIKRLRGFFRVGYYLPVVTSIVAVAVVWRFLLQDNGLVNRLLGLVGINGPDWLNSTTWALPALILMAAWRSLGTLMIIFLAGLQTVPKELYEAAEVDGAGRWSRFWHITLPGMRPTLLFGTVITSVGFLQFFEEPFVMTQGGPLDSTRSVAFYIFDQFGFGNYSYAAAASYVLFIVIVALTAVQFRLFRER